MVSRTSADDFPWHPHEVELDLPERDARNPFGRDVGPARHPLVVSRHQIEQSILLRYDGLVRQRGKGLRVHLDSGSGPKTQDALRRSFGRCDLQLNSTGNSGKSILARSRIRRSSADNGRTRTGTIWFPSVRAGKSHITTTVSLTRA